MPPPKYNLPRDERTKREELKTYRELELRRDLKSVAQRKRVEANGLRRVFGDGSGTQPYLIVEAKRYRAVRLEVQKRLLLEARASAWKSRSTRSCASSSRASRRWPTRNWRWKPATSR